MPPCKESSKKEIYDKPIVFFLLFFSFLFFFSFFWLHRRSGLAYWGVRLIEHESRSSRNPPFLELLQLNLDRSSLSPPCGHRLETWMIIKKLGPACLEHWSSASVAPLGLWVDLVTLAGPICLFWKPVRNVLWWLLGLATRPPKSPTDLVFEQFRSFPIRFSSYTQT